MIKPIEAIPDPLFFANNPLKFAAWLWPDYSFYREQRLIIESVRDNKETYAIAGNQLGKDFVSGFIALWFFLTRHPCKIITTSAKDDHLRVLWGEINRFVRTSKYPLLKDQGGILTVNQREIRKNFENDPYPDSYIIGMVASDDSIAAMGGHHANPLTPDGIPHSLLLADECSSVKNAYYDIAGGWFQRGLFIGNAWPCSSFFKKNSKAGDLYVETGSSRKCDECKGLGKVELFTSTTVCQKCDGLGVIIGGKKCVRKVLRIKAEDSPNVRLGELQVKQGLVPTNDILIPGVLPWDEYQVRRKTLDKVQACVKLDAEWYEGEEELLYPPNWLNYAEECAVKLQGTQRQAKSIGCDPGQGSAETVWAIGDEFGLMNLLPMLTPDTSTIPGQTIALMQSFGVPPEKVFFDPGGGGKQHADTLRRLGYNVQLVPFGTFISKELKRGMTLFDEKRDVKEEHYVYVSRRAQMYWMLSEKMDPHYDEAGNPQRACTFTLPVKYTELRRQLAPMPKRYTEEGRRTLPPKNRPTEKQKPGETYKETLFDILGCSPDQADAVVLMNYGLTAKPTAVAGRAF